MKKVSSLRPLALATAAVFAPALAIADDGQTARAVIRGTGNDVKIVYRAPKTTSPPVSEMAPEDPLAEALRLKTSGSSDRKVLEYLRRSEAALPDVIDADYVRQLRRAGAGETVVAFLSASAALDIGETGEGSPAQALTSYGETSAYAGAFPDLANMSYPFYGSYGGGYFGGRSGGFFGHRSGHRGFSPQGPAFFRFGHPFGHPFFPKARPLPAHGGRPSHGGVMGRRMK